MLCSPKTVRLIFVVIGFLISVGSGAAERHPTLVKAYSDVRLDNRELRFTVLTEARTYNVNELSNISFAAHLVQEAEELRNRKYLPAYPQHQSLMREIVESDNLDDGRSDIILVHEGPWKKLVGVLRFTRTNSLSSKHPSEKILGLQLGAAPAGNDFGFDRKKFLYWFYAYSDQSNTDFVEVPLDSKGQPSTRGQNFEWRELKTLVTDIDLPLGRMMFAIAELNAISGADNVYFEDSEQKRVSAKAVSTYFATASTAMRGYYLDLGFEEFDPLKEGGQVVDPERLRLFGHDVIWLRISRDKYLSNLLTLKNSNFQWSQHGYYSGTSLGSFPVCGRLVSTHPSEGFPKKLR